MSEALLRIEKYAEEFSEGIERCRNASPFKAADWEDAYNRLNRVRERYCHEKDEHRLDPHELKALQKVFEEDLLIEEMLKVARQIGEHVHPRKESVSVRLLTNSIIPIGVETSALAFFGASIVKLPDDTGRIQYIDHLQTLAEAERRIKRALDRAQLSQR
jgi:hypothetical protein